MNEQISTSSLGELSFLRRGRVAVLVDGENLSAYSADRLLDHAKEVGEVAVCRVYGNVQFIKGWCEHPAFQVFHTKIGRNIADIALVVGAMELASQGHVSHFVIAASDSGYAILAHKLREMGFPVVGIGGWQASRELRESFSQFHEVEGAKVKVTPLLVPSAEKSVMQTSPLVATLREIILEAGSDGVEILRLNVLVRQRRPGFLISAHEKKNWRAYLLSKPEYFDCDPRGVDARVRWIGPR